MEELFTWLESIHPLSQPLREYLALNLGYKEVKEMDYLLKIGHVCRHIYFVEKGSFRSFYFHHEAEVNNAFMFEWDLVTVFDSFLFQKQSDESIQALKDSKVYFLSFEQLKMLVKIYPELIYIAAKVLIRHYGIALLLLRCLRVSDKRERYYYTRMHFPEIFYNVFQKDLATFINVHTCYISNFKTEEEKRKIRSKW